MLRDYQLLEGIRLGRRSVFNQAVTRGASIDAEDPDGRSAMEVAVRSGQPEMLRELIQAGADSDGAVGKRGDRLIHLATKLGDIGCMVVLLADGMPADSTGHCGRTPLHIVSKSGGGYMARLLFEHHANPDFCDAQGNTPLHVAAERGNLPMVKLMIKHHASALITNNQLYTPVHDAAANGHTEVAKWLLGHEQVAHPSRLNPTFVDRIQRVAERHGHSETANAIAEHSHNIEGYWGVPSRRSSIARKYYLTFVRELR